jgi:hypothetical protein
MRSNWHPFGLNTTASTADVAKQPVCVARQPQFYSNAGQGRSPSAALRALLAMRLLQPPPVIIWAKTMRSRIPRMAQLPLKVARGITLNSFVLISVCRQSRARPLRPILRMRIR